MKITNNKIYTYANQLIKAFQDGNQKLPVKINFYLQKNKNTLLKLAQEIEESRMEILQSHSSLNSSDESLIIPPEKISEVTKELNDLFNLEQDVNIYMININSLTDDYDMTTAQMEAIMFMIEE